MFIDLSLFNKILFVIRRIMTGYCLVSGVIYYMNGDTFIANIYAIAFAGWIQVISMEKE
jgi:hypothetical protein